MRALLESLRALWAALGTLPLTPMEQNSTREMEET
jgi:hypothetical protein